MTIANSPTKLLVVEDNYEIDRRRTDLLNDPNYGIVLCFLDKFQSVLDLPIYPLQRFEDHLVNYIEQIPSRLIDFHYTLLKRLSLAKNAQRDRFDSIITRFASRFDANDGEHLKTAGYLQADVSVKIRIIKNLFESQFDIDQTLINSLIGKLGQEIRSSPLGRDRFGVSYWLFMDKDGFVRLFREYVDFDRTWTNIAKNKDELEKFIKLLITDRIVRKRFSDWHIDCQEFSSLLPSDEFEQYYCSSKNSSEKETIKVVSVYDADNIDATTKRQRRRTRKSEGSLDNTINIEKNKEFGRSRTSKRLLSHEFEIEIQSSTVNSRKRRFSIEDVNKDQNASQQDNLSLDDISLEVRRSSCVRKSTNSLAASKTNVQSPIAKKKCTKRNKTNKSRRRRKTTSRRNKNNYFCSSSSSDDEHLDYLLEDEYDSDDYLPDQSQIDMDSNFFELEQEENTSHDEPIRTAKTAQTSTIITSCCICSKDDRPEILLLCDDCDDAYHTDCLQPILFSVPDGDWFCPLCEHRKLLNCLIEKFKELIINLKQIEKKQIERNMKTSLHRKTKIKEYNSDESITASESEHDIVDSTMTGDDSILSTSQTNENSNISSSYCDEYKYTISQRGRQRRTRFDMKTLLIHDDEFDHNSDAIDDEYLNDESRATNFNFQLPQKITRILHRRERSSMKSQQTVKTLSARLCQTSNDSNDKNELQEEIDSPPIYVDGDGKAHPIKGIISNSKQTSKIVRRWNDLQRRSRLKAMSIKALNETTLSDCGDENSLFGHEDSSFSYSNDSFSNTATQDESNVVARSTTTCTQPMNMASIDKASSKNLIKKADANFDRLTRDIQFAVGDVQVSPKTITVKATDQNPVKRIQKSSFSPYTIKPPAYSLSLLLSKSSNTLCDILETKTSSNSISTSDLIPKSPSSLVLLNDTHDQMLPMSQT